MQRQIWKFTLQVIGENKVKMPLNAEILCVQGQAEHVCIWASVISSNTQQERTFEVIPTGQHYDHIDRRYIGTIQLASGVLVFHVFERLL